MAVGPVLGFFGPILVLEWLTPAIVEYPAERSYLLAFGLPLLPGVLLVLDPDTRRWGAAYLLGTAVGLAILLAWYWMLLSALGR
jgi:hypothetical protein